ncbi:MAG TPA: flagellin [Bryobacteraceae bacterium]|jgi:flagellin|nr:flagellin [Bryobacteraceae bacterium]
MSISFQTNYAALVAENNINTNNNFQTSTIEALTSGYRINNSSDDAAGLAVANTYQASINELNQGVLNGNAGVAALQIADGGLSNITTILDRLQTLASESASTTFTGNRANINVEYQQLVTQITQQASNIGLAANGSLNVKNEVFIGGGNTNANSQVQVDLSGGINQVDANGLSLANTSVLGGGTELTGNSVRLDNPGALFLSASATQTFTFQLASGGAATQVVATVTGTAAGINQSQVLTQLNQQLSPYGISASVGSDGQINFGGSTAFTVATATADATDQIATTATTAVNNGVYSVSGETFASKAENLTFQNAQGTATVALAALSTEGADIAAINAKTASLGIYAVDNGGKISIQSANAFSAATDTAAGVFLAVGNQATTAPTTSATATGNALAAITAIGNAITQLGNVQSRVGAGENVLNYAINLANSQITNFSSAESGIKDANIAQEASNLTKAQVIEQASVAALAQANSAPQSLLKLLQ